MTTKKDEKQKHASLADALLAAKANFLSVVKASKNPFFKSSYANLEEHLDAVGPALVAEGVLLTQPALLVGEGENMRQIVRTELRWGGESMVSEMMIDQALLKDPQKVGSAITYYRRYTLAALLALAAEDDDGNTLSASAQAKNNDVMETKNVHKALGQPEPLEGDALAAYVCSYSVNVPEINGLMIQDIDTDFFEALAQDAKGDKSLAKQIDKRDLIQLRQYYQKELKGKSYKTKAEQGVK